MPNPQPSTRLYINHPLSPGALIMLDAARAHYLLHVMRKKSGDTIAVFNGEHGEWIAEIEQPSKKSVSLSLRSQLSAQRPTPDLWLAFAMIKNKSELVVEKATELGVSRLLPIVTQHAVVKNINMEKLQAHAIEAAEQCERHDVPEITPYNSLAMMLGEWPADRTLLYGDESGGGESLDVILNTRHSAFSKVKEQNLFHGMDPPQSLSASQDDVTTKLALLIGPEGGFSADEHRILQSFPQATPFSMGPRILRADTASVAALACVQMHVGDWHLKPHFKQEA